MWVNKHPEMNMRDFNGWTEGKRKIRKKGRWGRRVRKEENWGGVRGGRRGEGKRGGKERRERAKQAFLTLGSLITCSVESAGKRSCMWNSLQCPKPYNSTWPLETVSEPPLPDIFSGLPLPQASQQLWSTSALVWVCRFGFRTVPLVFRA